MRVGCGRVRRDTFMNGTSGCGTVSSGSPSSVAPPCVDIFDLAARWAPRNPPQDANIAVLSSLSVPTQEDRTPQSPRLWNLVTSEVIPRHLRLQLVYSLAMAWATEDRISAVEESRSAAFCAATGGVDGG